MITRNEALHILNLTQENPTDDELKEAYRRAAMRTHPDRKGGKPEDFARVTRAYSLLNVKVCATCGGTGRQTVYDGPMKRETECPKCWNLEN